MHEVSGIYRNGIFVADQPVDWPEGTAVVVMRSESGVGIDESQWPSNEEQRKVWLAWFDSVEPVEMSRSEQSRLDAAWAASRQQNIEAMRQNWDELEELF